MPHICTRCNNVFDFGEDILKGCPSCGWKKFMFVKDKPRDGGKKKPEEQLITEAMGVKRPPRSGAERVPSAPALGVADYGEGSVKSKEKSRPERGRPAGGIEDIRLETGRAAKERISKNAKALESVKIMGPGTYELNLPSLFERDELIMAVKDGTYFIDLTSAFKKGKKD